MNSNETLNQGDPRRMLILIGIIIFVLVLSVLAFALWYTSRPEYTRNQEVKAPPGLTEKQAQPPIEIIGGGELQKKTARTTDQFNYFQSYIEEYINKYYGSKYTQATILPDIKQLGQYDYAFNLKLGDSNEILKVNMRLAGTYTIKIVVSNSSGGNQADSGTVTVTPASGGYTGDGSPPPE